MMVQKIRWICLMIGLLSCLTAQAQNTTSVPYPTTITLAADGSGDFKTIGQALNAVRAYSPVPIRIFLKNGTYREKVTIPSWVTNLTLTGESRDKTILTWDDYSGKALPEGMNPATGKDKFTTFNTYTVWVQGNDVTLDNLTIQNTAGRVGQAVALHLDGDRIIVKNCSLLGNQDTLLTANDRSRQYFQNCLIEGTVDFIFGPATAVFQSCTLKSLTNGFVTAASTPAYKKFGYVFMDCELTADAAAQKVFLGRPWRTHARTVFLHSKMGSHIVPEGWDNWNEKLNEKNAYYAEYESKGPGGTATKRVGWSHQLTTNESKTYTLKTIFEGWEPAL